MKSDHRSTLDLKLTSTQAGLLRAANRRFGAFRDGRSRETIEVLCAHGLVAAERSFEIRTIRRTARDTWSIRITDAGRTYLAGEKSR